MRGGSANFVIRFISDMTGYNPASKVREQNQQIAASGQQAQAAVESSRRAAAQRQRQVALSQAAALPPTLTRPLAQSQLSGATIGAIQNAYATRRQSGIAAGHISTIAQGAGLGLVSDPQVMGLLAGLQSGSGDITALANLQNEITATRRGQRATGGATVAGQSAAQRTPSGRGLISHAASMTGVYGYGGIISDLGELAGVLPKALPAVAAVAGIGAVGVIAGLGALTTASLKASKALGTAAYVELEGAADRLNTQLRFLGAEFGNVLLPILTKLAEVATAATEGIRGFLFPHGGEDTYARGATRSVIGPGGAFTGARVFVGDDAGGRARAVKAGVSPVGSMTQQPIDSPVVSGIGVAGGATGLTLTLKNLLGFQAGGLILPTQGGTIARLAEGGEPEAVLPLRHLAQMMGGRNESNSSQMQLSDLFLDALDQSNELPPLWQRGRQGEPDDDRRDDDGGGVVGGAPAAELTFITRAAYTALVDKTGYFAVY